MKSHYENILSIQNSAFNGMFAPTRWQKLKDFTYWNTMLIRDYLGKGLKGFSLG